MNLSKQQSKVYNYLLENGRATVRDLFPFTNYPTCVIRDLRRKGIEIETIPGKKWDEYKLNQLILF